MISWAKAGADAVSQIQPERSVLEHTVWQLFARNRVLYHFKQNNEWGRRATYKRLSNIEQEGRDTPTGAKVPIWCHDFEEKCDTVRPAYVDDTLSVVVIVCPCFASVCSRFCLCLLRLLLLGSARACLTLKLTDNFQCAKFYDIPEQRPGSYLPDQATTLIAILAQIRALSLPERGLVREIQPHRRRADIWIDEVPATLMNSAYSLAYFAKGRCAVAVDDMLLWRASDN